MYLAYTSCCPLGRVAPAQAFSAHLINIRYPAVVGEADTAQRCLNNCSTRERVGRTFYPHPDPHKIPFELCIPANEGSDDHRGPGIVSQYSLQASQYLRLA